MSAIAWTDQDLLDATGGTFSGLGHDKTLLATGIHFDTRQIKPGDMFLALKGERDGHDFVPQAFEKGAALAITRRPIEGGPCLLVSDVQKALDQLAVYSRQRAPQAKRGAVTGSVGKTSVTQMVMAGLKARGRAHSAVKSFNNHIGVPLTLARMPWDTERAVFELGMNHAGEIGPLSELVAPDAAIITTVGAVHTENFPDGEAGVARAKAEIFEGMSAGQVAILNADNPWYEFLKSEARAQGLLISAFGEAGEADARLLSHEIQQDRALVKAQWHGRSLRFSLQNIGRHQALNALSVLLMLEALDVDLATSIAALEAFAPLDGRGKTVEVPMSCGNITLIDESYNANPMSMKASLESLARLETHKGQRKIAVLTDMLELGPEAPALHEALGRVISEAGVDKVYCAGALMDHLWQALPSDLKGAYAPDAQTLIEPLKADLQGGDVVMIKGSNGSKAHLIAHALISD